jgi:hypothetical protein
VQLHMICIGLVIPQKFLNNNQGELKTEELPAGRDFVKCASLPSFNIRCCQAEAIKNIMPECQKYYNAAR